MVDVTDHLCAQLIEALSVTLSPDSEQRAQAERVLAQLELVPRYLIALFRVAVDPSITADSPVRHSAAVALKNLVSRRWENKERGAPLPEEDKSLLRENLVEGVIAAGGPGVKAQLGVTLKSVAFADYPHVWTNLLDQVTRNLTAGDHRRTAGTLYIIRLLVKKYEYKAGPDREPLQKIVDSLFPQLLAIFEQLITVDHPEAYDMERLLCKIFWSAAQSSLPRAMADGHEALARWLQLIVRLLECPVPVEAPGQLDALPEMPVWKCKKWASHIAVRMMQRYGRSKFARTEGERVTARQVRNTLGVPCLHACLDILQHAVAGRPTSPRVSTMALNYVGVVLVHKSIYAALRPQAAALLENVVLPFLRLTDADLALWAEDPAEFVRKTLDVVEEFYSPKASASNLLVDLVKRKPRDCLESLMAHCNAVLVAAANAIPEGPTTAVLPRDLHTLRHKEAVLCAIGHLAPVLRRQAGAEQFAAQMEPVLRVHALAELASPVGFMRARACILYSMMYRHMDFGQGSPHFAASAEGMLQLLNDDELPVRVQAASALEHLVPRRAAVPLLLPRLAHITERLFALMHEVGNEETVTTLDALIGAFGEHMAPYAVRVVGTLAAEFHRVLENEEDEEEDTVRLTPARARPPRGRCGSLASGAAHA